MTRILIAEPSYLLRKGLAHIIDQFQEPTEIEIIGSHLGLTEVLHHFAADLVIINTSIAMSVSLEKLQEHLPDPSKIIHLINTPLPPGSSANHISIYDSKPIIVEKLSQHIQSRNSGGENAEDEQEELTAREKLILKNVSLGLINKEIATKLFISAHTVISHRKNITRKLGIKSVSGLTVYAILNGIIKMEDIS